MQIIDMDILLVEDELEFAGYPKRGLPHAGYRKSFAQNSEEGLENFDQSRPLFLILDVMLPDMGRSRENSYSDPN